MTEQHRHHLGPAAKPPSMVLCSMPAYRLFKLGPRKYPQNLRKNTAYSTHGGKLLLIEIGFPGRNPNLNLAAFPPPLKKLIWTRLSESSPGRSPGFGMHHRVVPKGRLKTRLRCSAVPRGTVQLAYHYPGLSSWAIFRRPYGTLLEGSHHRHREGC